MQEYIFSIGQPLLFTAITLLFLRYRFNIQKWGNVYRAVLLGMVAVSLMMIADLVAGILGLDMLKNLKRSAFYSFVVIGSAAEIGKFVFLRYYFLKLKSFRGPLDGIIYSIILSVSFTIIALPLFVSGFFSRPVDMLFLFSYVPVNIAIATIMGFFIGMGKLRRNRLIDSLTGLGAASFFHGFYYFTTLTNDKTIFYLYGGGLVLIAMLLMVKAVNIKDENPTSHEQL
jgi:RsiW-degrading membrane proteinase PrsW (M82 family)